MISWWSVDTKIYTTGRYGKSLAHENCRNIHDMILDTKRMWASRKVSRKDCVSFSQESKQVRGTIKPFEVLNNLDSLFLWPGITRDKRANRSCYESLVYPRQWEFFAAKWWKNTKSSVRSTFSINKSSNTRRAAAKFKIQHVNKTCQGRICLWCCALTIVI